MAGEPWSAAPAADRRSVWPPDVAVVVATVAYCALLGGAVGLVWHATAPALNVLAAVTGSEAATKTLLDDDVRLGVLGVVAGVVSTLLLLLVARDRGRTPAAAVGLAVGGLLGAVVAAHVGALAGATDVTSALHRLVPHVSAHDLATVDSAYGFRLRAAGVVVGWPLAAVVVHAAAVELRDARSRDR